MMLQEKELWVKRNDNGDACKEFLHFIRGCMSFAGNFSYGDG